ALLLAGHTQPQVGAMTLADGSGLAWVDNARGLLIHQVRLAGDRVQRYRIVAPTEWNFHPAGALQQALLGANVADAAAALRLAEWLVHSLDPCVACRVELDEAG
ncbi:MAG: nickel-dependent hydrogenase large subunit, partial [Aquabacterium sp.]|nr:nickel-dependent hydrogenase large subunit [Aquabacterium sp.]